jgi:hypothetical protein
MYHPLIKMNRDSYFAEKFYFLLDMKIINMRKVNVRSVLNLQLINPSNKMDYFGFKFRIVSPTINLRKKQKLVELLQQR